jgi:CheY-like chemotaxis protein
VLVAEDNELNAEIARMLLQSKHFEVDVAPNGLKVTEMFVKSPVGYYDAILMDIRMPLVDGLQAATNIRHWEKDDAATIPIVAMTANAFEEDIEKSRAAGMNAHLSKPIEPRILYSTLDRLLNGEARG